MISGINGGSSKIFKRRMGESGMLKMKHYKNRFINLLKQPFFWILTLTGNIVIFLGGFLLYLIESPQNNSLQFLDALLWSMGIVTTVGYGNFIATTATGKWLILFLMAFGTLFIWSYMAFIVTGLINPELSHLERDVQDLEKEISGLKADSKK